MFSKSYKILIIAGILGAILSSCQPAVRFTAERGRYGNKEYSTEIPTNRKTISEPIHNSSERPAFLTEAETWLGAPYKYGGNSRSGIDCSGFVQQVFAKYGINLPRTAAEQFAVTQPVADNERKNGDLVFFQRAGKITHVGILISSDEMIHASSSRGVIRQSLDNYSFSERYAGARRISALP